MPGHPLGPHQNRINRKYAPGKDPDRRFTMKNRNEYAEKRMTVCRCGSYMYFTNKVDNKTGYFCVLCHYETSLHRFPFLARWEWNRETQRKKHRVGIA